MKTYRPGVLDGYTRGQERALMALPSDGVWMHAGRDIATAIASLRRLHPMDVETEIIDLHRTAHRWQIRSRLTDAGRLRRAELERKTK